jgi:hypothetical protein
MENKTAYYGGQKPPYENTRVQLLGYNIEALEENFNTQDLPVYAAWAWETIFKSSSDEFIIKFCAKKKFEIYPSPRDKSKTAEQETFEFLERFMRSKGVALPMELTPWREGTNQWHQVCLWKKALHLLLMSKEEYWEHKRHREEQSK